MCLVVVTFRHPLSFALGCGHAAVVAFRDHHFLHLFFLVRLSEGHGLH
jgi:hypothetical protein